MKTYWIKDNASSASFVRGKGYTVEELKQITGVFNEKILIEQILLVFDEYDTNDTKEDELEVNLGVIKKYGPTSLFATRFVNHPLYPEFSFQLYVGIGPNKREKVTCNNWESRLPLWLRLQINTIELAENDCHSDNQTTILTTVKDGQRVWDIMEKMSALENVLK